ncbi:MAG: MFS transporter [Sphingomonadales bacterium]|nr:MFS transporter [Sphingomonadales bacterium]
MFNHPADGNSVATQPRWTVFVLAIAVAFSFVDRQILALLVIPIKRDLVLTDTQMSLLIGFAFVVFYVGVGIPLSRFVDHGPRKWIIGIGMAFWSVMTAACGLAQTFWQLALARVGVGVGESCNTPATYSMIADMYPREKLARAIALVNLGNVGGQGLAFFIGGVFIIWLGTGVTNGLPLIGNLRPWQLTFLLLGIPGLIWSLVVLATVPEPARRKEAIANDEALSFPDAMRFLVQWRAVYVPLILGITIKAMLSFGTTIWAPAFLERSFGWKTGEPGIYIGFISLIVMPAGLLLGGWLTDRRTMQGHDDANMLVMAIASTILLPFAILFPLMPNAGLALFMLGGSLFFGAMGTSPGNAAIQVVTPGRMRGTITAFYIAVMNILGNGLGPLFIALLTDRLFRDEAMLPQSMALAAVILGPIGVYLSWSVRKAYLVAMRAAKDRAL